MKENSSLLHEDRHGGKTAILLLNNLITFRGIFETTFRLFIMSFCWKCFRFQS